MTNRIEQIRTRLVAQFHPEHCELEDESALHAGHEGAASGGGHYRLRIVADAFIGRSRIERHRLVYDCVRDLMQAEIHALTIIALAPSESAGPTVSTPANPSSTFHQGKQ